MIYCCLNSNLRAFVKISVKASNYFNLPLTLPVVYQTDK